MLLLFPEVREHDSVAEHLLNIQKVPISIPNICSQKDQVVGGMKDLDLSPWRAAVSHGQY